MNNREFSKIPVSRKIFLTFDYVFLSVLALIMLYPIWYVICAAFSSNNAFMANDKILIFPLEFTTDAFKMMFKNPMIVRGLLNGVFLVAVTTFGAVIMTSMCAYVLSRKGVLWNKAFSKFVIFTMYFNGGLIPTYLVIVNFLHLNDSWLALILPALMSVYNMIIMRTSFSAIPQSLEEAARIDGASHWVILFRIVLPLSKAIIAVMCLYYAVGNWNSWFPASIYLKTRSKYPIQLILREILIANDTSSMTGDVAMADQVNVGEIIKYAVIVTVTLPILAVYPFLQKYFVGGVMIGAVKG